MTNTHENPPVSKTQKILGERGLLILISFLSAFVPLSTDLYLPALPKMAENLGAPVSLVNLTLTLFFLFYAVATLFWGPLSDKYGRKKILLIGLVVYMLASVLCALSGSVSMLIAARILQAIGSGAVTAVSTAIVKDVYSGRKLETTLSVVQSMTMIAPIVAPLLGGIILSFTTWRGSFFALFALSAMAFVGALAMEETIGERVNQGILQSLGRLAVVLRNKTFVQLVLTFSLVNIPFMSYIAVSSYIYVGGFGVSEQVYSYYFAANAVFLVLGPLLYIQLSKFARRSAVIAACFGGLALGGVLLCTVGTLQPWAFALSLLPASFSGGVLRPPSSKLMLDQAQHNIGSMSAIISFAVTIMGAAGMTIISLDWPSRIVGIGILYLITTAVSVSLWFFVCKPKIDTEAR